jgi:hypothetical protein
MNPIQVNYTDQELRILVEEFIAMQRSSFTFKGLCSYILYRAMEEGRTKGERIYESNQMQTEDCNRVKSILKKIVCEGRIATTSDSYSNDTVFFKK